MSSKRPVGEIPAKRRAERRRTDKLVLTIAGAVGTKPLPSVSKVAREKRDPFRILVSTIISLRTKDQVTDAAARRLFALANSPEELVHLPLRKIEKAIYPAGFYKTKAKTLKEIARKLLRENGGRVPDRVDELLELKGVGRKTATLVVSLGYGKDAICVDTHVHRVSNRLGLVVTKNPTETEFALMEVLPKKYWVGYNELLVRFGQQICKPISPHCSTCPVRRACPRRGVDRHR
jgi:endonuclease-3